MLPMLQIGPLNFQTAGLVLLLSVWLGMYLCEILQKDTEIPADLINTALYWGLGGGIISARLGYAFASPMAFLQNPLSLLSLNTYQFDLISGIAGFFLTTAIFSSRKVISYRKLMDDFVPFFICVIAGYQLSTLASGEIYGSSTHLPWAISLFGANRHPVQIYDVGFMSITGLLLFYPFSKTMIKFPSGGLFLTLIAAQAVIQILTIPFRADPGITIISGIRLQQIVAWIVLAISLFVLGNLQKPVQSRQELSQ